MKIQPESRAQTEDAAVFGNGQYVYCLQHMAAHLTGWCGVDVSDKIGLGVPKADDPKQLQESLETARVKCRKLGLKLYCDSVQ